MVSGGRSRGLSPFQPESQNRARDTAIDNQDCTIPNPITRHNVLHLASGPGQKTYGAPGAFPSLAEHMEPVPYLDLKAQYDSIRTEVLTALAEVCESGRFAQGPATSDFETKFAAYCGVDHCVSLNSGTSALHLALRCLDIRPGDEVITVGMTFIGTAWAISYVGAKPVFVDIDPARRTISPGNVEAAITPRTKAIIPVHLYGMPAEMDRIKSI